MRFRTQLIFLVRRFRHGILAGALLLSGCGPMANQQTPLIPLSGAPDAASRKIPGVPARFSDVAETAGLHYRWVVEGKRPYNILQTIGNGCAFLDYDQDGNLDILLVGAPLALYKGDGHGHFTDVTHDTRLDRLKGHFLGVAVGDYDNDGYPDVYLSGYRTGVLLHNERGGGGRRSVVGGFPRGPRTPDHRALNPRLFRDVTREAGLKPQPWGTSAAWAETVPGSGRLDLFVANYARFGPQADIPQLCDFNGVKSSCGPRYYHPIQGVLYHNLGQGRFADISASSGIAASSGRGLGVAFADLEGKGVPSLAIANDEMAGDFLVPRNTSGPPHYSNAGASSGIAFDRDGNKHGGMGADWGDYDNDGRLDLIVTTFQNEPKSLYHNEGNGQFSDLSYSVRLGAAAAPNVSFGCKFLDFDNDGRLDLMIASGHVQDNIEQIDSSTHYRQPVRLYHNELSGPGGKSVEYLEVSAGAGAAFQLPIVGRGLAIGDFDNDGKMDALVVDSEGKPLLLHNETVTANHWLGVRLIGVRCSRDGYGALLTARFAGRSLLRACHADGSYLSSSDPRVHFGLGSATQVDTLTVRWPDGHQDVLHNLPADRYFTVREGGGEIK